LGYFDFDNTSYNPCTVKWMETTFYVHGAEIAFQRGMIVVNSAGNSGASSNPYVTVPGMQQLLFWLLEMQVKIRTSFSSIDTSSDNRDDSRRQGKIQSIISDPLGNIVTATVLLFKPNSVVL
jgi:hypothetical protein